MMDTLSHACFSYAVCRASGVAPSPRAGLVAAGVAVLPDLDFLLLSFLPDVTRFAFHRGPSHSIFIALFAGLIFGYFTWYRKRTLSLQMGCLVCVSWLSHLFLDMCTGFGVALWWPFSHARESFDLLFVVDPLATLPLFAAVCFDLYHFRGPGNGRKAVRTGLAVFAAYAATAFVIRETVSHAFEERLRLKGRVVRAIHAEPTPFNHQLWYLCAKTDRGFVIAYRSIWDGDRWEEWTELPIRQTPLHELSPHPLIYKMKVVLDDWFTIFSYGTDHFQLVDLLLGKRYGWEDVEAPFLFVYTLRRNPLGQWTWTMRKPGNRYNFGRLARLFQRVTGHIPSQDIDHRPSRGIE